MLRQRVSESTSDEEVYQELKGILKEISPGDGRVTQKCQSCSGYEDKILPTRHKSEIAEMEKHEILVRMAEAFGQGPEGFGAAEEVFDELKYRIARFVIFYEFNESIPLSTQLALWLDMQLMPKQKKRIERLIHHYFEDDNPPSSEIG
jgi:hypothetical protein